MGRHVATASEQCVCGRDAEFDCSGCGVQGYCGTACQTEHWPAHAGACLLGGAAAAAAAAAPSPDGPCTSALVQGGHGKESSILSQKEPNGERLAWRRRHPLSQGGQGMGVSYRKDC